MEMKNDYEKYISRPCLIPVKELRYEGGFETEYKPGEYTGRCSVTLRHCFSLYNGGRSQLTDEEMKGVIFK